MQGSKTPDDVEQEFRKHYLVTGSVAGAAKAAGIPIRTGYDLAKRANEDEEFAAVREQIYARTLPDAEVMILAGMQIGLERLNKEPLDPMQLAGLGAAKVTVQDSGAQYLRSLVAGYEAITKNRRLAAELNGDIKPTEVVINVSGPDSPPPTGSDGEQEAG
jgi:hypothetical protein